MSKSIDSLITNGIDLKTNTVVLVGDLDDSFSEDLTRAVVGMNAAGAKEITVYLNSTGGDVYCALGLYDLLRASEAHIKMVGVGLVASAAVLVYLAGDTRIALPNTRFMLHSVSAALDDASAKDIAIESQETVALNKLLAKITADRTGHGKKVRRMFDRAVYLSAQEAREVNICTEVQLDK